MPKNLLSFETLNKAFNLLLCSCSSSSDFFAQNLTLFGAWWLPQSMYSPTDIDFC